MMPLAKGNRGTLFFAKYINKSSVLQSKYGNLYTYAADSGV